MVKNMKKTHYQAAKAEAGFKEFTATFAKVPRNRGGRPFTPAERWYQRAKQHARAARICDRLEMIEAWLAAFPQELFVGVSPGEQASILQVGQSIVAECSLGSTT